MQASTLKGLSTVCLVAGNLSMAGSIALWATGRASGDRDRQHDGLFVGLWVPTFFILADRLATAALDVEERLELDQLEENGIASRETIRDRSGRGALPTARQILRDEKNLDESQTRPQGGVNKSVNIGAL